MLPSQAGPGNDINAGSPGSQKAPTRSPASPGAIRPGSTLIEEVRFATVSPPEGDDSNPRSPSTVSSLHAGARDTTHGVNDRICHQGANAKLRRKAGFPDHGGNFPDRPI